MLNAPAPFGQLGSWALLRRQGEEIAVRIVDLSGSGETRTADVSRAGHHFASGRFTVPVSALVDPTPLDAAERDELERLTADLGRLKRPERSPSAPRFEALCIRQANAARLVALLEAEERRFARTRRPMLPPGHAALCEARRTFAAELAAAAESRREAA